MKPRASTGVHGPIFDAIFEAHRFLNRQARTRTSARNCIQVFAHTRRKRAIHVKLTDQTAVLIHQIADKSKVIGIFIKVGIAGLTEKPIAVKKMAGRLQ
jgi:hypothetical protein